MTAPRSRTANGLCSLGRPSPSDRASERSKVHFGAWALRSSSCYTSSPFGTSKRLRKGALKALAGEEAPLSLCEGDKSRGWVRRTTSEFVDTVSTSSKTHFGVHRELVSAVPDGT